MASRAISANPSRWPGSGRIAAVSLRFRAGLKLSPGLRSRSAMTRSPSRRVCSIMITASAPSGMGAPVMISTASPGPTDPSMDFAGANFAFQAQSAWQIGGADRVAVAGRAGEGRIVAIGGDGFGKDPPGAVEGGAGSVDGADAPRAGRIRGLARKRLRSWNSLNALASHKRNLVTVPLERKGHNN